MPTLVLWRHGQTDFNLNLRIQGTSDIPLNETGRSQAAAVAPEIAALGPTRIVASPLGRAQETAGALAALTGLPVESDPGLVERDFGVWEGLNEADIVARWPEEFALWRAGGNPTGVGVEPRGAVAQRVGESLVRIMSEVGDDDVVVATAHGSALSQGTTYLLGMDAEEWAGLRGLDNCHYALLSPGRRAPGWTLRAWNLGSGEVLRG